MPNLYPLIGPSLRRLPREAAHELSLRALEAGSGRLRRLGGGPEPDPPILAQRSVGPRFREPDRARRRLRQGRPRTRCDAAAWLRLCRGRHRDAAPAAGQSQAARVSSRQGSGDHQSDGVQQRRARRSRPPAVAARSRRDRRRQPRARTATAQMPPADYAEGIRRDGAGSRIIWSSTSRRRTRPGCAICKHRAALEFAAASSDRSARKDRLPGAAAAQDRARPDLRGALRHRRGRA